MRISCIRLRFKHIWQDKPSFNPWDVVAVPGEPTIPEEMNAGVGKNTGDKPWRSEDQLGRIEVQADVAEYHPFNPSDGAAVPGKPLSLNT